jgi:hypothetical protein
VPDVCARLGENEACSVAILGAGGGELHE